MRIDQPNDRSIYAQGTSPDETACREALAAHYDFQVFGGEDGVFHAKSLYNVERGTPRTSVRFVQARFNPKAGSRGLWEMSSGIRYFESRAPWRVMRTSAQILEATTFARVAVERARHQIREQVKAADERLHAAECMLRSISPIPSEETK